MSLDYDEMDAGRGLLTLSCANSDGAIYIARAHIIAIAVDWTTSSGVVTICTSDGDEHRVTYDDKDQGERCGQELAAALTWFDDPLPVDVFRGPT